MISLTEQAKCIVEKSRKHTGVFIFCNKRRAEFRTADIAHIDHENYAFAIRYGLDSIKDMEKRLLTAMLVYCVQHGLEYVEK